jgi:N-acetylglucosaminyl-diphospho-decaprenol L-rhamnosyltransferase
MVENRPTSGKTGLARGKTGASVECMARVDVVVVAYNSREELRGCVAPLSREPWANVIVVDNESPDGSLEVVSDLDVDAVGSGWNGGFAFGVNTGWRRGSAPYVLLLNPDARIEPDYVALLADVLDRDASVGIVGPKIVSPEGELDFSQRRFPRLRSTYAQALFLHRALPGAAWTDEVIRNADAYERDGEPDWISGACLLVRRTLLEELDGLDESFFMYGEDKDLCRRVRSLGYRVRFVAGATSVHVGGASTPRASSYVMLATSRRRYAAKHGRGTFLTRVGIGLGHATHLVLARGRAGRVGHLRALRAVAAPLPPPPQRST